jgi:peroxiredoxin Q/BCP
LTALQEGRPAPDFALPASNGETVRLSDFRGRNVVLYFYPKDLTPGCTTEACDFRDFHPEFEKLNTVVLGVSADPIRRHGKFAGKYGLPFLLLSDEDHKVAELYGVWQPKKMFGRELMGIVRSTFVIDAEGRLAASWRQFRVDGHVREVLQWIRERLR